MSSEKPKAEPSTDRNNGTKYTHPAFGEISITRGQCPATELFGSSLKHRSVVRVTLSDAYMVRDLSRDWIFSDKHLVSFTMSEHQWSALISAVNGNGIPVTFETRPTEDYSLMSCPAIERDETQTQTMEREVREATERYLRAMRELTQEVETLVSAGKANKTQLNELAKKARHISEGMPNTMSFIQKQSETAIASSVAAGKAEMEGYLSEMAKRTGLDALRSGAPLIESDSPQKTEK